MADEVGSSSAGATTSTKPSSRDVDVFLNLRGPDCRSSVVRGIYDACLLAGVRVFYDDESTRHERTDEGKLMEAITEAITNSSIYIPIFSRDYASSTWCLRELETIMNCYEASQEKTILPIFHDVDIFTAYGSRGGKLEWQTYTPALRKHKEQLGEDVVRPWEIALQKAAKISGLYTCQQEPPRLTKLMMEKVCRKLLTRSDLKKVSNDYVGMEDPMQEMMKLLDLNTHDVRFLTIHGIQGVGKTTLAKCVFDKTIDFFKPGVAFLSGIRQKYRTTGIVNLQKDIISQLLQVSSVDLDGVDHGVDTIKETLKNYKRVLIVLDDLDNSDQLLKLAGEHSWFDMGSRIIITTRDIGIIPQGEGFYSFEMPVMGTDDALKLFSRRVFGSDSPPKEYDQVSRKVVETTEGHPLAVGVIAPFFRYQVDHENFREDVRKIKAEATTSGTPSNRDFNVFLNFRGPDSRATVVDVLYDTLVRAGVRVLYNDESMRQEDVIGGELTDAISNSKIYIPIFSSHYASSRSCLRELEKIIEYWDASQRQEEKIILPIFYDVDVSSDVKLIWEVYTTALQKHKEELGEDKVEPWEVALRKVANFKGFDIRSHGLIELANLIAEEVCRNLWTRSEPKKVPNSYIEMDDPLYDIMKLLDLDAPDVRFVAIHGVGGVGKTTLARLVYHKISSEFQPEVAFLSDIRYKYHIDGIKSFEKYLESQLPFVAPAGPSNWIAQGGIKSFKKYSESRLPFVAPAGPSNWIAQGSRKKKVLIVLDDVDSSDQLMKIAGEPSWFCEGSRVIITTRNIEIISEKDSFYRYEMQEMRHGDALKLFSKLAFESDLPPKEFRNSSVEVVDATERLPLTINVIGPLFRYKRKNAWSHTLKKIKKVVGMDVSKKMMISYEELHNHHKEMFLDIACFFINKEIEDATYYWEAQECKPMSGIMVLENMSLIEIVDGNKLGMHDLLIDLGRSLVDKKTTSPGKRSRLWSPKEALSVIQLEKGTKEVVALKLGELNTNCYLNHKQFVGLTNLKLLEFSGGNFKNEDFKKVLSELRWLSWDNCPAEFQATNLCFERLLVLMLSNADFTDDWGGWGEIKAAKDLKVLKCTNCCNLTKSPQFSTFPQLERLVFKKCPILREIDPSIGMLEHLTYLEFTELIVKTLPDSIGGLKSLSVLKLASSRLIELPSSIGKLENLKYLCLKGCSRLEHLPETVGNLKSLVELEISGTAITMLPESVKKPWRFKGLQM